MSFKMIKILFSILFVVFIFSFHSIWAQDNESCLDCHSDSSIEKELPDGAAKSMFVNDSLFEISVHGDFSCIDCHIDLESLEDFPHEENLKKVDCSTCHDEVTDDYMGSLHGKALTVGNPMAPTCASCHTSHNMLSEGDPKSSIHPANLPNTCAVCHSQYTITTDPDVRIANSFAQYKAGVHGVGIEKGVALAATCNDCHGTHKLWKANDVNSMVNRMNIPKTCSKCHNDFYYQYMNGIHGKALVAGVIETAICTDCHGEHKILDSNNPDSPIHSFNIAENCSKCHEDDQINEKYGLPMQRLDSYNDSYHGWAIKGGSQNTASCISCHNAHDILPSSNEKSSVHESNITKTCRRCHYNANYNFAHSYTHKINVSGPNKSNVRKANDIISTIYIVVIILVIGSMLLHNAIIFIKHIRDRYHEQKQEKYVIRFSKGEILQHLRLMLSFTVLVITGFALRFPGAWWVDMLNFFGIDEVVRGIIHRGAAVLFFYTIFQHAGYLVFTRRGRNYFKDMLPRKSDLMELIQNMKYHLGLSDEPPKHDRFEYTQKAEYWALVWGGFIMGLTGLILWLPTTFTTILPGWTIKISETIHYYEAWLATLAIIFFHFFMVIGHPEEYPMNISFITGRMTEDVAKNHYPRWFERVKKLSSEKKTENGDVKKRKSMLKDIIDPDDEPEI